MSRPLPIDPAFRSLIAVSLMAAGCPARTPPEPPPEPMPPTEVTPDTDVAVLPIGNTGERCDGNAPLLAADSTLALTQEATAVALRTQHPTHMPGDQRVTEVQTGELCGEDEACLTAMADDSVWALSLRSKCGQMGCSNSHIAWSGAEGHGTVGDKAALTALLGDIDTPDEARLVAWASGYDQPCAPVETEDGYTVSVTQWMADCPIQVDEVQISIDKGGTIAELSRIEGAPGPCVGRLGPGSCAVASDTTSVGGWLAQTATMEAEAVHAFDALVIELVEHAAPDMLVHAALSAKADEQRHAAAMTTLAVAWGVEPAMPEHRAVPVRSLFEIALDNAAEGLGREVWGAILGTWQGAAAADPQIAATLADIASDELRHAELSKALDAWIRPQLTRAQQRRLDRANRRMWKHIEAEAMQAVPHDVARAVGLPTPAQAQALARRVRSGLRA